MTNLRVDTIRSRGGDNGPIFEGNLSFSSTAHIVLPKGTTAQRPVGIATGAMRYNTTTSNVEYYNGTSWVGVTAVDFSNIGVFGGGTPVANTIDFISITVLGNAIDFGDLTVARSPIAACSSSTRGVFGGGGSFPGGVFQNVIDYITIITSGNALDFGDLSGIRSGLAACSSSTRGVFGGGWSPGAPPATYLNTIEYVTIATTGNTTDFGDLTLVRTALAACSSSTRGVFGGGYASVPAVPTLTTYNTIDYITIASVGNATDFGDLTVARHTLSSCSSSTRGVFAGGGGTPTIVNTIDYITIASVGNATDFGDLTVTRSALAACSSSTRGVFGGGSASNTIDYITIATTGNATDFGDLTRTSNGSSACSNVHGGL